MSRISTHVLDTALGRPAAGMMVHLEYAGPSGPWEKLGAHQTDDDGRCANLLPQDGALRQGQYRLIIISRPTINREMFGIMTTLRVGRGTELIPVSSPIAYVPLSSFGSNLEFGRIDVGHACYQQYRKLLKRTVEEPFALFLQV